jgi:hypothetical protein
MRSRRPLTRAYSQAQKSNSDSTGGPVCAIRAPCGGRKSRFLVIEDGADFVATMDRRDRTRATQPSPRRRRVHLRGRGKPLNFTRTSRTVKGSETVRTVGLRGRTAHFNGHRDAQHCARACLIGSTTTFLSPRAMGSRRRGRFLVSRGARCAGLARHSSSCFDGVRLG